MNVEKKIFFLCTQVYGQLQDTQNAFTYRQNVYNIILHIKNSVQQKFLTLYVRTQIVIQKGWKNQ